MPLFINTILMNSIAKQKHFLLSLGLSSEFFYVFYPFMIAFITFHHGFEAIQ